jgi:hypothetical protein
MFKILLNAYPQYVNSDHVYQTIVHVLQMWSYLGKNHANDNFLDSLLLIISDQTPTV